MENLGYKYGYGSIPINTIFRGMNIHKSQLFGCEQKGYNVLTHCHMEKMVEKLGLNHRIGISTAEWWI